MKIVFASNNKHKIFEINEIAKPYNIEFVAPHEQFDPIEDGETFEENAIIKAREASKLGGGEFFLSDDSGLCIDALNGAPGIHSARYATTNADRIKRVLDNLQNEREAHFCCAMVLCNKNGEVIHKTKGICKGKIAYECAGNGGFGYDPIFIPAGYNFTLAEIPQEEKNRISHRGKALCDMLLWIKLSEF